MDEGFKKDLFELHAELGEMKFIKEADNPFFKSKYQDLPSLTKQVTPVLQKHNFIWFTRPSALDNGAPALGYTLLHKSGDIVEGVTPIAAEGLDAQKAGGAITYFRRYILAAVLNIVTDEDDDGNKASGRTEPRENKTESKYREAVAQMLTKLERPSDAYNGKKLSAMTEKELLAAGKALAAEIE